MTTLHFPLPLFQLLYHSIRERENQRRLNKQTGLRELESFAESGVLRYVTYIVLPYVTLDSKC